MSRGEPPEERSAGRTTIGPPARAGGADEGPCSRAYEPASRALRSPDVRAYLLRSRPVERLLGALAREASTRVDA